MRDCYDFSLTYAVYDKAHSKQVIEAVDEDSFPRPPLYRMSLVTRLATNENGNGFFWEAV